MIRTVRRFRLSSARHFLSVLQGRGFGSGPAISSLEAGAVYRSSGQCKFPARAGEFGPVSTALSSPRRAAGRRWPAGLAAAMSGSIWGGAASAGGYVAPFLDLPPVAPVMTAGAPQSWWLALIPLFLVALSGRGGRGDNGLTPLPPDHGGPCFGEGTLVQLTRGWVPVETIRTGEEIVTSRGIQAILSVEYWRPVNYQDRPVLVEGVRLSPNHGVSVGEIIVPACKLSAARSPIDGGSYFHILVEDHSWLFARAVADAPVIRAESLCMTADLKLAKTFPELVARHAADPVASIRVGVKDHATRTAA